MDVFFSTLFNENENKDDIVNSFNQLSYCNVIKETMYKYFKNLVDDKSFLTDQCKQVLNEKCQLSCEIDSLNTHIGLLKSTNLEIEKKNKGIEDGFNALKIDYENLSKEILNKNEEIKKTTGSIELLRTEKSEYIAIISRKENYIQQLDKQWSELSDKFSKLGTENCEMRAKLDEIQSNNSNYDWKKKMLYEQSLIYENQISELNALLESKNDSLFNLRNSFNQQKLKLDNLEEHSQSNEKLFNESINSYKNKLEDCQKTIQDLRITYMPLESALKGEKIQLETEIDSLKKLCNLYQEEKLQLVKNTSILDAHLEDLNKKVNVLEQENFNLTNKLNKTIDDNDATVVNLKRKLEYYEKCNISNCQNDTFQETRGKTVSQVYSDYYACLKKLEEYTKSLNESKARNECLNQDIKTLNEHLQKCRADCNRGEKINNQITKSVIQLRKQLQECKVEINSQKETQAKLKQSNQILVQTKSDLSLQICHFLKKTQDDIESHTSNEIINQSLLNFEDIKTMQCQNIKLVESLRILASKLKENVTQKHLVDQYQEKIILLGSDCNNFSEEIKKLKNELFSKENVIQRQMLLIEQLRISGGEEADALVPRVTQIQETTIFEQQVKINDLENLNKQFNLKTKELSYLLEETKRNHTSFLQETSDIRSENEKLHIQKSEVSLLLREVQNNAEIFRNESERHLEKLNLLEKSHRTTLVELAHFKAANKHLETQLKSLENQKELFNTLWGYLQRLQSVLDYKSNSDSLKLVNEINELKDEMKNLQYKMQDSNDSINIKLLDELNNLRDTVNNKDKTIDHLETRLSESLNQTKDDSLYNNSERAFDKEGLYEQIEQYKALATASEQALNEALNEHAVLTTNLQDRLVLLEDEIKNKDLLLTNKINEKNHVCFELEKISAELQISKQMVNESALAEKEKQITHLNKITDQLREKYESEIVGHASDISRLKELQQRNTIIEKEKINLTREFNTIKHDFETLREQYKISVEERDYLRLEKSKDYSELEKQNFMLQQHIDKLNEQFLNMNESGVLDSSVNKPTQNHNDLWEMVKYNQREKNIAETKLDLAQSEVSKFKIKVENLEKSVVVLQKSLEMERDLLYRTSMVDPNEINNMLKLKDEHESLKVSNNILQETNGELENKLNNLREKLESNENDGKVKTETLNDCKLKCETLEAENEGKKRIIENLKQRLKSTAEKLLLSEKKIDELKNEKDKIISDLEGKGIYLQSEMDKAIDSFQVQMDAFVNEKKKNDVEISSLKKKIEETEKELRISIKRNQELHTVATRLKSKESSDSQANSELDLLKKKYSELSKKYISLEMGMENTKVEDVVNLKKEKQVTVSDKMNKISPPNITDIEPKISKVKPVIEKIKFDEEQTNKQDKSKPYLRRTTLNDNRFRRLMSHNQIFKQRDTDDDKKTEDMFKPEIPDLKESTQIPDYSKSNLFMDPIQFNVEKTDDKNSSFSNYNTNNVWADAIKSLENSNQGDNSTSFFNYKETENKVPRFNISSSFEKNEEKEEGEMSDENEKN